MLETHRLAARRGFAWLFADLDLGVAPGEVLVITGPNGSGKTTLLRILAGLALPTEGELRWQGERVEPFDARLRECVAFNGHLPALKDELTAEENLRAWTTLEANDVAPEAIADALDFVGLSAQRALPARVLSQGQRRRIGLARLRLARRTIWILDEPLTALDRVAIDALGALLEAHAAGGGLCIAASHQSLPLAARSLTLAGAARTD
ncbi:MAG TPA: cytochrome c biogenesis heme-transporting ATPase CcmA [Casimicrobiaceae bacterium]